MRRARARTRRGAQDPELLGSVFAGSPARREHLSPPRPPTAERARAAILRLTESADCLQRLVRDSASRASGSNNTNGYISWPKLLRRVYALFADPTCRIQVDRRVVSYRRIAMIMPAAGWSMHKAYSSQRRCALGPLIRPLPRQPLPRQLSRPSLRSHRWNHQPRLPKIQQSQQSRRRCHHSRRRRY